MTHLSTDDEITRVIVFIVFGLVLGGFIELILKYYKSPIPYTVLVFYAGLVLSLICKALHVGIGDYATDSTVAANIILYGFLPTLLFSETMNINLLHFSQSFLQSVILAGPGGVIVACQLAICAYLILPFNWSWNYYFLFGSIMCATDPVSVVSLLKTSHASSALSTVIAGESLMNDGSAMILYFFFYNMINGQVYTPATFVQFVAEMILLSPTIGIAIGFAGFLIIRRIARPTNLHIDFQIAVTFICAYTSYFVAGSVLEVSGVLSCCGAGVTVALLVNPSIVQHEKMQETWELMEWSCNTLIFLLGGFIGGEHTYNNFTTLNVILLIVMYFFLTITRAVMVTMLFPLVSRIGMRMSPPEGVFCVYAGLRGALAIALALDASRNAQDRGNDGLGGQFFFIITGVVSMTLLINGSTAGQLLVWLGLVDNPAKPMSLQKQMVLLRIKRHMKEMVQDELEGMTQELGDYDKEEVARLCSLQHSEYGDFTWRNTIDEFRASSLVRKAGGGAGADADEFAGGGGGGLNSVDKNEIDNDLIVFTRTALLEVVRARYMESIHTGKIGSSVTAAKMLLFSIDVAMDHVHQTVADWDCIERSLTVNSFLLSLLRTVDETCLLLCQRNPGAVATMDAYYERVAIYVLVNYIEAHEYALGRLHFIMGMNADDSNNSNNKDGGGGGGGGRVGGQARVNVSEMEENQVTLETLALLDKAKHLLSLMNAYDVRKVYTHRAARIILIKQQELLGNMVREGTLGDALAHSLFDTIQDESDKVNLERAAADRSLVKETRTRKVDEEQQMRESFRASNRFDMGRTFSKESTASNTGAAAAAGGGGGGVGAMTSRASLRGHLTGDDSLHYLAGGGGGGVGASNTSMKRVTSGGNIVVAVGSGSESASSSAPTTNPMAPTNTDNNNSNSSNRKDNSDKA